MTYQHQQQLSCAALRPDYLQYFIFYTVPLGIGWRVVSTWSADSAEYVKGSFLNDFWDESPRILFVVCPGPN